jgi:hypothetical protein
MSAVVLVKVEFSAKEFFIESEGKSTDRTDLMGVEDRSNQPVGRNILIRSD